MGGFVKCFSIEELETLDAHKVALLREAIERELANSPEIREILRAKTRPVYDRLSGKTDAGS
ncbi:MAG: hypothetical protein NVSMB18_32040 [Acetobacteraceae bacterium]